MPKVVMKLI